MKYATTDVRLKVGCGDYDCTQALLDGGATITGAAASFESAPVPPDVFGRMVRHLQFDVAELELT